MLSEISRNWWLLALRGMLASAFGAAAFVWPGATFELIVLLFGAYALIDGLLMLSYGMLAAGEHENGWPLALGGILGIAAGVLTLIKRSQNTRVASTLVDEVIAVVDELMAVVDALMRISSRTEGGFGHTAAGRVLVYCVRCQQRAVH